MITYTTERIAGNIVRLEELAKLHYKEVAPYEDIPLNINWAKFVKMNEIGVLILFVMRQEGELVGYSTFTVSHSIEYSTSIQASLSNIFIHPSHRGRGMRFISWCDEQLKNLKVQVVYHHVKVKNDYGVLLKRLGYDIMNIEYTKRLD